MLLILISILRREKVDKFGSIEYKIAYSSA